MNLSVYLGLLDEAERTLARSFRQVGEGHGDEPDIASLCQTLAKQCDAHVEALRPVVERYGEEASGAEPDRLHAEGLSETRSGPVGLLRDLQDLHMLVSFVEVTWVVVGQAAQALHDEELLEVVGRCDGRTTVQKQWLLTRMKQAAPQALVAAG